MALKLSQYITLYYEMKPRRSRNQWLGTSTSIVKHVSTVSLLPIVHLRITSHRVVTTLLSFAAALQPNSDILHRLLHGLL